MIKDQERRQWAMVLHLSQLAGFVVPLAGFIVPILIWQLKKDEIPELNVHGKIVINWMISQVIYVFVSIILIFVVVGLFIMPIILLMGLIFPIIGGIKASEGKVWKYPLSFKFV